jgi:DNA-3-methyladenine glycosylase
MKQLPASFFQINDVVAIARDLIGKVLVHQIDGKRISGIITETEAYKHINDKASHAWNGKRTRRNEAMYAPGGSTYVYQCYGIHKLFNVVTNLKEIPDAVLIRATEPYEGADVQVINRNRKSVEASLSNGPGKLTQALAIGMEHNMISLSGKKIWIEDQGFKPQSKYLEQTSRIGIDYAGTDASLPYRFIYRNTFLS